MELGYGATKVRPPMEISDFDIPGPKLLVPKRFIDARGFFCENWNSQTFRNAVSDATFVQDNVSLSIARGTVRGLHFQKSPYEQGKLVQVVRGAILDVAVDIRADSPTFGRHIAIRLDSEVGQQLWVPAGFLHGFCTLEDDTQVAYKVTQYYSAAHDAGVLWNDPDLNVRWPLSPAEAVLSDKDRRLPRLRDLPDLPFR
jgi:dTDP-4-dehydrorhamnose 3,5-epimerase